ncbi:recombination protein [Thiomonas sp. X19]|uniref:replication-associated recombination protein A n=1 Tax=Thiomonas sp. X19 TaxID=1050370 RepID=UPI000B76380D|nr:replication-associated recombination protein A [Thiomonas sp. X19]SCC92677.1 recombination protein [Thiomonas sp. X19]
MSQTPSLFDPEPAEPGPDAARSGTVIPLAERLRPRTLADVVGQAHLLGPGKPLRLAFDTRRLHSMILWGPPGVGKTTLARLIAKQFDAHFIAISAVLAGVKEIREAVLQAEAARANGRPTLVFVDEVHRFNKSQQDAFLPHVESGLFTFIGATTENPSFEVNSALLSRATVYVLQSLSGEELQALAERGLAASGGLRIEPDALALLAAHADGDARRLFNAVEAVAAAAQGSARDTIDLALLEAALTESLRRYDKGGDQFYDVISALHKSVRGSDPDAALYWMARMLDGGVDPLYIGRRLIRMASEDIGLADPRALGHTLDAVAAFERLGSPEGELALVQAVLYLAIAPKSNAVYRAAGEARRFVREHGTAPVPMHLRNAPTKLMKQIGASEGYRYAHDEAGAFAAGERYFPEGLPEARLYRPTDRGQEARIAERMAELQRLNRQARAAASAEEPAHRESGAKPPTPRT